MEDNTYNGWSNRETWAANLHLSNDYRWYTLTMEVVRKAVEQGATRYRIAHHLESCFKDYVEDPQGSQRHTEVTEARQDAI